MFWSPARASSVVVLGPSVVADDGPTTDELTASAAVRRDAIDGAHLLLPDRTQLLLTDPRSAGPLAAQVPVCGSPKRALAATNFGRTRVGLPPQRGSRPRRHALDRLALRLRALDAALKGVAYREIAVSLFGERSMPSGAAWKTSDVRSRAVRLVADGRALMLGGYLKLVE